MKYLEFKILNPKYQIIHTKKKKKTFCLFIYFSKTMTSIIFAT